MDDDGEPMGRGQLHRRAAEARALHDAAFAIAIFTGIVLVNGILAILLIELFQVIGWWEARASETTRDAPAQLSGRCRADAAFGA